jgi:peptidoglycan hydrolase-like protein with peptidoglycan-binding domain
VRVRTRKSITVTAKEAASPGDLHVVKLAHLTRCTSAAQTASAKPAYRQSVELVQRALSEHPAVRLRNVERGVFNTQTRSALAAFQRYHGVANATGNLTVQSLTALAASQTPQRFTVSD